MMDKKQPHFFIALIPLILLVAAAACSIFIWKAGMFIPLITGIAATAMLGIFYRYKWPELETFMKDGVSRALPAVFILLLIGTIIGTWILSGVIPTIIYYGLLLINPNAFIPAVAFITGVMAFALGSSFTSIATIGLAFMAVGQGMGFPAALVAGAVISGAFFGDKLSPLSDTTNVAPAMVDTDLFSHVRHMLWDTIPAFFLALVLYWIVGLQYSAEMVNSEDVQVIMDGLQNAFAIHPLLLLLPLFTMYIMIRRFPAIPSLVIISVLGGMIAVIVQGGSFTQVVTAMTNGYTGETGIKAVDALLQRGGITSMLNTIGLLVVATALGGILEGTGTFKAITDTFIKKVKRNGNLVFSTILSTFVVAFASGAQFLAIILPARAYAEQYKKRGLDTKNLSRCVEAAGTVGINLVPWGVPAVFAAGVLGVSAYEFIPYIFFAFLVPVFNIIYGYTGISLARKTYPGYTLESKASSEEDEGVSHG